MSVIIEFYDAPNAEYESRQFICNVWPLTGADIGDALILNQPVAAKSSRSQVLSRLVVKDAGNYLLELVHPGGRRTQRMLRLPGSGVVRLELPWSPFASKLRGFSTSHPPRSAAPVLASSSFRSENRPSIEILAVPAQQKSSGDLGNLRAFLAGILACRHKGQQLGRIALDAAFDQKVFSPTSLAEWKGSRVWLLVRYGGVTQTLIAYPKEWEVSEDVSLSVLATRNSSEDSWRVSLRLLEPARVSLVEFLSNRDWESAWATYLATEDLHDPVSYSRVISAYTFALAQEERVDILGVTDATKADIPDFHIALAWQYLQGADVSSHAFSQARRYALDAVQRGFPVFTMGFRVLSDVLNYISSATPKDSEIKLALGTVTRAVMVCVPGETFTTIDVSRLLALSSRDNASEATHA